MTKEYLGKSTVASLIRLIKTELGKYVKMESMDNRIPAPTAEDDGKFVKVVDGKYEAVEQEIPTDEHINDLISDKLAEIPIAEEDSF